MGFVARRKVRCDNVATLTPEIYMAMSPTQKREVVRSMWWGGLRPGDYKRAKESHVGRGGGPETPLVVGIWYQDGFTTDRTWYYDGYPGRIGSRLSQQGWVFDVLRKGG